MHRSIKPVARRISANKRHKSTAVEGFVPGGEIVVYKAPDGEVQLDVHLKGETVWLTQQQIADLFGRERTVITGRTGTEISTCKICTYCRPHDSVNAESAR
jgi:hypothetical protein